MISKYHSLVQEHPHSYEVHDAHDGQRFHVAKAALSPATQAQMSKMPKFADGGKVGPTLGSIINFPGSPKTAPIDSTPKPKNYDDGGEVPVDLSANAPEIDAQSAPASIEGDAAPTPDAGGVSDRFIDSITGGAPNSSGMPTSGAAIPGDGAPMQSGPVNPVAQFASSRDTGLNAMETGIQSAQKQEIGANAGIQKAWGQAANQLGAMKTPEAIMAAGAQSDKDLQQAFLDKKVDPNRYWNDKSTVGKISAGLGMILGGFSAGQNGGNNQVVNMINNAIDKDIDAQKNDQSKSMNLWKMNREATQNELSANLATRNQLLSTVEAKTKSLMASVGGAEAQTKFAPLLMSIEQQKNENNLRMGLAQGGQSDMDPATLVPMMVKNPEQQKQAYEEIQRAKNVAMNKDKIMAAFDQAAKDNTIARTGAGFVRTPASVLALHQLMLPNFKQVDGTVRQAAMDESFHNLTPSGGDFDATTKTRRQALQDWMTSEQQGAVSKGNGLDLTKFKMTNTDGGGQPQTQKMNGVNYIKVPGGWKKAA